MIKIRLTYFVLLFSFLGFEALSSHIRAGEIIVKRITDLRYEFTFFGYRDIDGVLFGQGVFDYGDGNKLGDDDGERIPWEEALITPLGNGVERWQFSVIYDYAGPGTYVVSYKEDFRNADIQNISGSNTTPFYVETKIVLDALFPNNSPFFTVPPIDQAAVGAVFEHNPGAVDPDGDSLAYYFTTPKQDLDFAVNGYRTLIDQTFYEEFSTGSSSGGIPILEIDEDGTIIWDAPGGNTIPPLECREFNVAFVVEEYRKINGEAVRLGFVTRDMQIIVCDVENDPPEIELPEDTCVVAGGIASAIFTSFDPDGDPLKIEAFGNPFEIEPSANFTPNPAIFQASPATAQFTWETSCELVRAQPYEVIIKATDDPNDRILADLPSTFSDLFFQGQVNFETWKVTVVGPAPTGLMVEKAENRTMELSWDAYECPNADSIQIWRRVGEYEFDPICETGVPENAGYTLIETLEINRSTFTDNNNGAGLAAGSKYCYRLVAQFPPPLGGESLASEEACDSLLIDVPVITNVDTKTTSETNGIIEVKWIEPLQIDTVIFRPPFSYELLRSENGADGPFMQVFNGSDTLFSDNGLNTKDVTYTYQVKVFDRSGAEAGISSMASSVRLIPTPRVGGIRLNWSANVPWSLNAPAFPYHYIYRDNIEPNDLSILVLIDSVDVTMSGLSYFDDGIVEESLDEDVEYCYFVTTSGSYGNALLPEPLLNSSQKVCAQPNDTVPPCRPLNVEFNSNLTCEDQLLIVPCGVNQFQNSFNWNENVDVSCDDDISHYNVYYSPLGEESDFEFLAETKNLFYNHENLSSLAGCYYITAIDFSGNESDRSEIFCNDNCPKFELPNVITPNGDGKNDFFRPFRDNLGCPRFVKSVKFTVTNRAGVVLFTYDSEQELDISSNSEDRFLINWDGKSDAGQELPSGTYFYAVELEYLVLNPEESEEVIKGWIEIIR